MPSSCTADQNTVVLSGFYDAAVAELAGVRPSYIAKHELDALPPAERRRRMRFTHRFPASDTWRRQAAATIDTLALLLTGAGWTAETVPVESADQSKFVSPCYAPFGYAHGRVEPNVAPTRQRLLLRNTGRSDGDTDDADADALTSLMWTLAVRTAFYAESYTRYRCLDAAGAPLTGYRMEPNADSDEAATGDPYWWCNLVAKPATDEAIEGAGPSHSAPSPPTLQLEQRDAAEAAHILVYWLLICHPLRGAETKARAAAIVASIVRSSQFGMLVAGTVVPKVTRTTVALGTRKGCVEAETAVLTITDATVAGALLALGMTKPTLWRPLLSAHPRFVTQAAPLIGGIESMYRGLGCVEERVGGGLNWMHIVLMLHVNNALNQATSLGWYVATAEKNASDPSTTSEFATCFDAAAIAAAWNATSVFHEDRTISGKGHEHGSRFSRLSPLGLLLLFQGWRGQVPTATVALLARLDKNSSSSSSSSPTVKLEPEAALLAQTEGEAGADGSFSRSWLMAGSGSQRDPPPCLVWPSPGSLLIGWLALRHTCFAPPIPRPPTTTAAAAGAAFESWRNPAFDDHDEEGNDIGSFEEEAAGDAAPLRCDKCRNREHHNQSSTAAAASSGRRSGADREGWRGAALPATTMITSIAAMRSAAALAFRVQTGPCGTSALGGLPWDVITEIYLFLGDWCPECGAEVDADVDRQLWYALDEVASGKCPRVRLF